MLENERPLPKMARTSARSWVARHLSTVQRGVCPLCKLPIDLRVKGEGVVDHCHDTGEVRGVLHRSCNAAEGRISNSAARWGCKSSKYPDIIEYLKNLVVYLESPKAGVIYFAHKSADEKVDARKVAAAAARAKAAAIRKLRVTLK